MTNKKYGTLYVGVTNNLIGRVQQHKQAIKGFTFEYKVNKLVYYETTDYIYAALSREKQIKKWNRAWKINLIQSMNKNWDDLYYSLIQ